jgi:hypothetical protein
MTKNLNNRKLSLEAFKSKYKSETLSQLTAISGGILGACHCVVSETTFFSSDKGAVTYKVTICTN